MERSAFYQGELRANTPARTIAGHAAVFNQLSENLGGFREIIQPGAFADTIKTADVRALWNHDTNHVLGRTKSRTLTLWEDERGLAIEAKFPDTEFARGLLISIERGDVDQMSFGFEIRSDGEKWEHNGGQLVRTLTKIHLLYDVSPVAFAAYPQTDLQARSLLAASKASELPVVDDDKAQAEFLARRKYFQEFIECRMPVPDRLTEIYKKARVKPIGG